MEGPMKIVKVSLEEKWYGLLLQHSNGHVEEIPFPDMGNYSKLGSPYIDHTPNPRHVAFWAAQEGYRLDPVSFELLVGRWMLECTTQFEDLYEVLYTPV
jgi:hypothetical protein